MQLEDFQLIDDEPIDNSITKRDYLKVYRQQGPLLNNPDQNVDFIFGENNNYYQIDNSYLEFDTTIRDTARKFNNASNIRSINNALAYYLKEGKLDTTGGCDLGHTKYVGQVSTVMR